MADPLPDTITNAAAFERNLPAGFDGAVRWEAISEAMPGKITPTDIDAALERNGQFLMFETKDGDKEVPDGQKMFIANLVAVGRGHITFLLTTKDLGERQNVLVIYYKDGRVQRGLKQNVLPRELTGKWCNSIKHCKAIVSFEAAKELFEGWGSQHGN